MIDLFSIGFINISLIDIIDVIIVTVLLYKLHQVLRNTIAVQIFLGIIAILAVYFLTEIINFRSLNWILQTLSNIWLLAFIVLFQPELRRLLLVIVRAPVFSNLMGSNLNEAIDEVLEAAQEMSEKHIGALIVFARARNIKMTIETGIPVQGVLSREMLLSIFNTKSPLHDGAVIVQNGMIEAAGCILPLSSTTKYQRFKIGTRHRAALGISEQADILALVVSEETGKISLAEEGTLYMHLSIDKLDKMLREKLSVRSAADDNKPLFSFGKTVKQGS